MLEKDQDLRSTVWERLKPRYLFVVPAKAGTRKQLRRIHRRVAEAAEKRHYYLSGDDDK